ncbi:MAG: hypothetical protein WKF49_06500 [Thermoleophilaceae bacterium]
MSSIVGPFPGVEDDYRRERISESFASHRKTRGRRRLHRRAAGGSSVPAIDWYAE